MSESKIDLLIVDDEPSTRYSLTQIFRCKGHIVRAADNGISALQEIRQTLPVIVLCDLNMPRMSGFELLAIIRRRFPKIFVIAMSGGFAGAEIPPGIAADLFYSKGAGLANLFQLMRDRIDSHENPNFGRRREIPVWVHPVENSQAQPMAVSHEMLIGCPECLRPFTLTVGSGQQSQVTDCFHCSAPFQYSIVS